MSRWAGVDPGEKRIGVARSDALGIVAQPAAIVASPKELVELLEEWVREDGLAGAVIGLPRNMDGTIGPIARRSFELVRFLRERLEVPLYLWDERLTTEQVKRSPGHRKGDSFDDKAAAVLLQAYLDGGTPPVADPPELATEEPGDRR